MKTQKQERERNREHETARFLKWIQTHGSWWHLICTPGDEHMNPQMMKLILEELYQESFYEIIFVLLMVHRNETYMESFYEEMLPAMVAVHWQEEKDRIIQLWIQYFS